MESGVLEVMSGNKAVQVNVTIENEDLLKLVFGLFLAILLAVLLAKKIK